MKRLVCDKSNILLIFVALFGFSVGLFDNYKDLWMSANGLDSVVISHIISVSYIVTVLVLLYFTIRVKADKLRIGIVICLILKMVTSTILICLNGTDNLFLIKFLMFFDIAFKQVIITSLYPLIMNINKSDLIYTKKETVMNIANKLGFLLVSVMLGRVIATKVIDYNMCLLFSTIFTFLAFIVLINIDVNKKKENKDLEIKKAFDYFKINKVLYLYLGVSLIGGVIWSSVIGMPMLTLTSTLGFSPNSASFFVLILGIISNILSILIVKYLRCKNDHINAIFKFGIRVLLYLLVFLMNNKSILVITFVYLLLSDSTYGFIFDSYFINKIDEEYSMFLVVLKYAVSLTGNAIGTFICGMLFNLPIKYLALPALVVGVIHYILCSLLINKKSNSFSPEIII